MKYVKHLCDKIFHSMCVEGWKLLREHMNLLNEYYYKDACFDTAVDPILSVSEVWRMTTVTVIKEMTAQTHWVRKWVALHYLQGAVDENGEWLQFPIILCIFRLFAVFLLFLLL